LHLGKQVFLPRSSTIVQATGLTPPDAVILRMLGASGGLSQQELATRLGIHPSRLVAIPLRRFEKKENINK